jgi:hypothetical protein
MNATEKIGSSIPMPLIARVRALDVENKLVEVTWAEGMRRGRTDVVNLSPLIDKHRFYRPLRNDPILFNTVEVMDTGEAIKWAGGSIDMSAESIERLVRATAEDSSRPA